jgi:integrase
MWREDGRQRSKTFNDRLEAKALALKIEKGESIILGNQTFGDLAMRFINDCKSDVKASTLAFYKQSLENHLLPAWKNKSLSKLRKPDVIELKTALQESLSASTSRNMLVVATRVLNHGIELEWLKSNVAAQVRKPKVVRREIRILSAPEHRALITEARPEYKMLFYLALHSGLRKGELLGLQWKSVDLDSGTIHVRQQYSHGAVTPPKTAAGRRYVPIDPDTTEQLKRWRAVARRPGDGIDLVFPSSTGWYQSASNVNSRGFKPALSRAGLPSSIRFHDLRHTYASMAIAAGVPLNDLKVVLGHSSISVTADIYGHLVDSSHDRIRFAFAANSAAMPDAVEQPLAAVKA